jgi:hypothetical protein
VEPVIFVSDATEEGEHVAAVLRGRGYVVADVPRSVLAVRAREQMPALIVCDDDDGRGVEALTQVRELPHGSQVHAVLIGERSREFEQRAAALTAITSGIYMRPVDAYLVLRRVEALLGPPSALPAGTLMPSSARFAAPATAGASSTPPVHHTVKQSPSGAAPPAEAESSLPPRTVAMPALPPPEPLGLGLEEAAVPSRRAPQSQLSPELQTLLATAEERARRLAPTPTLPPTRPSPEEELDAVLPEELLAALEEPLADFDEEEFADGSEHESRGRAEQRTGLSEGTAIGTGPGTGTGTGAARRARARDKTTSPRQVTEGDAQKVPTVPPPALSAADTGARREPRTDGSAPSEAPHADPAPAPPPLSARSTTARAAERSADTNPPPRPSLRLSRASLPPAEGAPIASLRAGLGRLGNLAGKPTVAPQSDRSEPLPSSPVSTLPPLARRSLPPRFSREPHSAPGAPLPGGRGPEMRSAEPAGDARFSEAAGPLSMRGSSLSQGSSRLAAPPLPRVPAAFSNAPYGPSSLAATRPPGAMESGPGSTAQPPAPGFGVSGSTASLAPVEGSPALGPPPTHNLVGERAPLAQPSLLAPSRPLAPSGRAGEVRAPVEKPDVPTTLGPGDAVRALARLVRARYTGAAAFESGEGIRRVLLRDGDFVVAATGIEAESLLAFLVHRGALTADAATPLMRRIPQFGRHAGAALVAHGHLRQDELWPVLRAHAEWLIARALLMEQGALSLEDEPPARLKAEPAVFGGATGAELLVELCRRVVPPELAVSRLGGPETRFGEGPSAMLLGECGLRDSELAWVEQAKEAALDELQRSASTPDLPSVLLALTELGVLTPRAGERKPKQAPRSRRDEADPLDDVARRTRLLARRALVDEGDYFALLGIMRDATSYDVRRAYAELRKELDPAQILTARNADLRDDLDLVLEVLDEAYELLRDPGRRERYRAALEASPS